MAFPKVYSWPLNDPNNGPPDSIKKQFARALKLANIPDGKSINVKMKGATVWHANAPMPILERPISTGDDGGLMILGTDDGKVDISAKNMPSLTSSSDIEGNLNVRHLFERTQYSKLIRGEALKIDIGEAPTSIYTFASGSKTQTMHWSGQNTGFAALPLYPFGGYYYLATGSMTGGLDKPAYAIVEDAQISGTTMTTYFNISASFPYPAAQSASITCVVNGTQLGPYLQNVGPSPFYVRSGSVVTGTFAVNSVFPFGLDLLKNSTISMGLALVTGSGPVVSSSQDFFSASIDWVIGEYGFFFTTSTASYPSQLATAPSWTQIGIGEYRGFLIRELSSSHHNSSRLNAFNSGSAPLEVSPVPASASMYYDKSSRFTRIVHKVSASDTPFPGGVNTVDRAPFSLEVAGRTTTVAASGVYINRSQFNPTVVEINVPEYGRIRDVRVWVELVHDVRSGTGSISTSSAYPNQGLQNIKIALRSPNVKFGYAHPLWNDPKTYGFKYFGNLNVSGSSNQFGNRYHNVPEILSSSYLLWDGHAIDSQDYLTAVSDETPLFAEWDTDIDMRTIFWDSSKTPNPRHLDRLYEGPFTGADAPLTGAHPISFLSGAAPNSIVNLYDGYPSASLSRVRGNNIPWMYDPRVRPGSITGTTNFTGSLTMSPPVGWLTGPGGTAAAGEFPTTGSQLGPADILPVYPLLDDIFVSEYGTNPAMSQAGITPSLTASLTTRPRFSGFRPGLRGTEINGTWKLMFAVGDDFTATGGYLGNSRAGVWFRQARLEFVVDQNYPVNEFNPSKSLRFRKTGYVPTAAPQRHIAFIQGASSWDVNLDRIVVGTKAEYGRTVGFTSDTGSLSFAVLSRVTGSITDFIASASISSSVFFDPTFGVPTIPVSLGGGFTPEPDRDEEIARSKELFDSIIHPKTGIPTAQSVRAVLSRGDFSNRTDHLVEDFNKKS